MPWFFKGRHHYSFNLAGRLKLLLLSSTLSHTHTSIHFFKMEGVWFDLSSENRQHFLKYDAVYLEMLKMYTEHLDTIVRQLFKVFPNIMKSIEWNLLKFNSNNALKRKQRKIHLTIRGITSSIFESTRKRPWKYFRYIRNAYQSLF